ncbi:MAG TPA: hypothetical protein DGH68_08990 [Bacteroidetes bacterium]|nr:hypothetical protein [Bacteroidota bacterium]
MKLSYSVLQFLGLIACSVIIANANPDPLGVYLQEGFNVPGILPSGWTITQTSGTTAAWSIVGTGTNPPIPPYAGAGQAKFNSYDASPGHQARLTSQRVNLSTSTDPFLALWMYHDDEYLSSLDSVYVEATTGDSIAGPWTSLAGYRRARTPPGWKQELISLLQYNGANRVFVSFRGVSQYGNNIYLDEVRIADTSFHDIGMVMFLPTGSALDTPFLSVNASRLNNRTTKLPNGIAPQSLALSVIALATPLNFGAVAQNHGTFSEANYQVRWQVDGQNQTAANNSRILPRNGRDTISLSWLTPTAGTHVLTAWTSLGTDSNRSNDSATITVVVLDTSIVFAEMFNGTSFPPPGWTVVNRDGGLLPPWFQGSSTSIFLPYEGSGFAANNFQRANGTYIDDYLITPPATGIGQSGRVDSLKFWVRSAFNSPPASNYPDSLMILLSTTGADTSNFTIFVDYFSVPKTGWTLKGYQLTGRVPSNSTVRAAFRYLHYNGGSSGINSDFVGLDFVHVTRNLPAAVGDSDPLPTSFALHQNYPNPFNPTTEILFSVAAPGSATLDLYNMLGQKVGTLFNGGAEPGRVYCVRLDGSGLASGIYYLRLQSGVWADTKKLVLLR